MRIYQLVVFFVVFSSAAWAYPSIIPPPPKRVGPPDGLPITTPRIKLRDGRNLSYVESGVPKDLAKSKIVYVHPFNSSKYQNPFNITASPALIKELGVYIVSFDRPGFGESDPNYNGTAKSLALDIEELADQLNLGSKFYVAGYSMGGHGIWGCLKYIPHRLSGAVLISPAINYWWPHLPSNLANEEFSKLITMDQWALRVAHYLPWLTYWWNSQTLFPAYSLITGIPDLTTPEDKELVSKMIAAVGPDLFQLMITQPRQQGDYESVDLDVNIGYANWEFDPLDIENPFPNNVGSVHLWQGDNDPFVSVPLQRYIVKKLGWIKYHEVPGAPHMMAFGTELMDTILKALVGSESSNGIQAI